MSKIVDAGTSVFEVLSGLFQAYRLSAACHHRKNIPAKWLYSILFNRAAVHTIFFPFPFPFRTE